MNMTCWATGQSAAYFEIKGLKFSNLASPVRIQFALTDCQSQNTRVYIQATNAPFRNVGFCVLSAIKLKVPLLTHWPNNLYNAWHSGQRWDFSFADKF